MYNDENLITGVNLMNKQVLFILLITATLLCLTSCQQGENEITGEQPTTNTGKTNVSPSDATVDINGIAYTFDANSTYKYYWTMILAK